MADEQRPDGSEAPPAGGAAKPAPPKPAAAKPAAAAPKPPATMAATPWDSDLARELKERFGARIRETSTYLGQNFVVCQPGAAVPILEYLKLEADFDYLVDITAVDWPKRAERFDLVYILYSFARNERVRVKTFMGDGFQPAIRRARAPDRQLDGARGVRHVRDRVRRPSRHAPHPHAGGMAGVSAAQGLRNYSAGPALGSGEPEHRKRPITTPCRTRHF